MAEYDLRLLRRDDDRDAFSCGVPALDRFLIHYAGQNQFRLHLSVTWVAARGRRVLGYATIAASSTERRTMPDDALRRRLPGYPLPVLRLARLGVDHRARGLGIGLALVRHVLRIALAQRDLVGCVGVVADAKPDAVPFYERLGFQRLAGVREGVVHGDPAPMFLAVDTVAAAIDGR